jgi:tetratricopeptide (TPR) repeat protein
MMSSDSKTRILRDGERYVQQGKTSLAIHEYLKIIKDDPDDVLTLNTLGDLYLRQGKEDEAKRLFLRVAENYSRNNFLLKAIAVYRKILTADPQDLEVNMLLASLLARQGMNVEAGSQYVFVAGLCANAGKARESLEAYEKVVEIDPLNSAVQLKLAEAYLAQDSNDKAYSSFGNAARAQMKAGDLPAAMASFRRALAINLASSDVLKGFLETALQGGDLKSALDHVQGSISGTPADPALFEVLGRAYQAVGDLERAEQYFRTVLAAEESRYDSFFPLSQAFLEAGDPDRALRCLEPIVPATISRRDTGRLVEAYNQILAAHPAHLPTLTKLAEILSATNEHLRCIAVLESIVQHYENSGSPKEALEPLEKILEITPDSEKHLTKHRELFEQAFPRAPYKLPRAVLEAERCVASRLGTPAGPASFEAAGDASSDSAIIEVDLLLNYGMKEKALQLLCGLVAKRPKDMTARSRLASLYREAGEPRLAAEQCILLCALQREGGNSEAAQKSWDEARNLAPDLINSSLDVMRFARQRGISLELAKADAPGREASGHFEVDLSGDLSEIFFQDAQGPPDREESALAGTPDVVADEFSEEMPHHPARESIEEQLQEVDFYIRLGFHDEARAKLDEIAATCPNHPELALRYSQVGLEPAKTSDPVVPATREPDLRMPGVAASEQKPLSCAPLISTDAQEAVPPVASSDFLRDDLETTAGHCEENIGFDSKDEGAVQLPGIEEDFAIAMPPAVKPADSAAVESKPPVEAPANSMFRDLMEEVNSLTDQEIAREDFETHFSLGIAFREMGLTEDAIKEFQLAAKTLDPARSPKEFIRCCGMLSTCFLEKGMARSAIRWCRTGLSVREISSHEAMALRYDMGIAHTGAGDTGQALECFGMIFGLDPSYRDVAQRIDDLKSGLARHAH